MPAASQNTEYILQNKRTVSNLFVCCETLKNRQRRRIFVKSTFNKKSLLKSISDARKRQPTRHCFLAVICFLPTISKYSKLSCCAWWSQYCCISHVCRELNKKTVWSSLLVILSLSRVPLSGCCGLTGETPQRLLRDTVKDASEKAKEAAKSLASAASAPQKPQQYI